MDAVKIEITDVLDLHTFLPGDISDLLDDYFSECVKKKIYSVRIIHGKGKGILRDQVLNLLKKNPAVVSFRQAPPEAGGWGATLVELKKSDYFISGF